MKTRSRRLHDRHPPRSGTSLTPAKSISHNAASMRRRPCRRLHDLPRRRPKLCRRHPAPPPASTRRLRCPACVAQASIPAQRVAPGSVPVLLAVAQWGAGAAEVPATAAAVMAEAPAAASVRVLKSTPRWNIPRFQSPGFCPSIPAQRGRRVWRARSCCARLSINMARWSATS